MFIVSVVNEESEEQLQKLTSAYEELRLQPVEKLASSINVDENDGEKNNNEDDKEVLVSMDKFPKQNDEPQGTKTYFLFWIFFIYFYGSDLVLLQKKLALKKRDIHRLGTNNS